MKKLFALIGLLGLVAGMGGALKAQEASGDAQSKLDTVVLLGINLYTFNEERLPKIRFSATPDEKFVIHWTSGVFDTVLVENEDEIEVIPSIKRSNYFNLIYLYALNPSGHITNIRIDSTYRDLQLWNCPLVDTINVAYNNLTSFDIHNCPAVKYIDISHNKLSALYLGDVSNVTYLDCSHNDILDITEQGYTSLETLDCSYNRRLRQLRLSDCEALTDLTVRCNDSLDILELSNLPLQHLTCTENQKLSRIDADNCRFQTLDVSGNPALERLECNYNQLTSLMFNNCPALAFIDCSYNQLSHIDLSLCKNLQDLYCRNNRFSVLDVPGNMILTHLDCDSNHIPLSALVDLVGRVRYRDNVTQVLAVAPLQVGELLDLRAETHLSDCHQCERYTIFSDGQPIEERLSDGLQDDYGLIKFDKAGNYRLHLRSDLLYEREEGEEEEGQYYITISAYYDLTVVDSVVRPQFSIPSSAVLPDTALILSTPTPDARIYYTTDGSEPDETALPYTDPIRITEAVTIKAIAIQDTFKSHIAIATYTIDTVARPTFSIPSGAVIWPDTALVLRTATPNAKIYYTIDGGEPDETALLYVAPIRITEAMTVKAVAVYKTVKSQVTAAAYTMDTVARPVFSIPSGAVIWPDTTLVLRTATPNAKIYYTIDGGDPDETALPYAAPIRITKAMTVKAVAVYKTVKSQVTAASYAMDTVARPTFSIASGKVKRGTTVSLNTATPNAKIYYTTDGSEPDKTALLYAASIRITEAMAIKAVAIYKTVQSQVTTATYTIDSVANEHDLRASKLRVYAKDQTIYLSEMVGEVEVFTMDGHCVYRGYDVVIPVGKSGLYIVSASGRRWKVAVR